MDYSAAAMAACLANDDFYIQMWNLFGFIVELESKFPVSSTTDGLRLEILNLMREAVHSAGEEIPEEIDLEHLSKCAAGALWCKRAVDFVSLIKDEVDLMARIHALMQRDFQEENS